MTGHDDRRRAAGNGRAGGWLESGMVVIGGAALLLATGADALDVLARHVGWRVIGAIEIVRAAILIASSAAIVAATIVRTHATVRLFSDRIPPRARRMLRSITDAAATAYFLVVAFGCSWVAIDLWGGHEESELLHIPYRPLRLLNIAALLVTALLFLRRDADDAERHP